MNKTRNIVFLIAAVGFLFVFGLLFLLLPKGNDFSEEENRMLSPAPDISNVIKGGFNREFASYLADRFPMRNTFIRTKAYCEILSGKAENNGVIFASDGYLVPRSNGGEATLNKAVSNVRLILSYSQNAKAPVYFCLTGRTADVESGRLQALYCGDGDAAIRAAICGEISGKAELCDLTDTLKSAADCGEYVYYKTDHHWTVYGAAYAYGDIVSRLGKTPRDFTFYDVGGEFYGTSYSAAGLVSFDADRVTFVSFEGIGNITVTALSRSSDGYTESAIGLYDEEALSAKDKYKAFLYGNFAEVRVSNGEERQKLLIIKDSYFNCVAPMLAADFDLDIIDPRYMRETDIISLCESEDYAAIIYVYGAETFIN